ncbi:hypothetical protein ACJJTC_008168 [Scirpophaga incertulas]
MSGSESDGENFTCYGTPLDPIDTDEVPSKRKFQDAPDQYAVDANGKRRFHGAFTGGFTAGYGNTVGTPEGWNPASYKSSRSDKAQISAQRPEDFMDEEDRSEFGIAPRHVQTQSEFTGQKRKYKRYHDGPIPGEPVLEQLLTAVHETAAVRMLRQMGWKPGQGTGVRVTREEKRRIKRQHKVYGCYMPPEMKQSHQSESDSESSGSEYDYQTLFAPDDYEPYVLQRKNDCFGLGYSGLSRHSVLGGLSGSYGEGSTSHLMMKDKGKKVSIRGQAFGVGAFEADDEDIYATEDMSHYDFELRGASKDKKKDTDPKLKGVNVLEGFVKASKPFPSVASHPPPALPRDYVPAAAGARRSRFEPSSAPQRNQGLGRHELTAEARGAILGEELVKKPPEEITATPPQQMPVKLDVIAQITGRNVNFVSTSESSEFISIKDSGKEVPKTFKPFAGIPAKQLRYERFLKDKEGFIAELDATTDAVSEWERNRELVEFEQAAKLYKPLTGIMGERFTHASEPDDAVNPLTAVARSSSDYGLATPEQVESAKVGVYGTMTRRTTAWRPEALVCKRFNIPQPGGGDRIATKTEEKPKVAYSIFSYLESSVHDKNSFTKEQSTFCGSKSLSLPKPINDTVNTNKPGKQMITASSTEQTSGTRLTAADLFLKETEKNMGSKEYIEDTIQKFDKMDLYKSIFLCDSDNEEDTPNNTKSSDSADANDFVDKPANIERNMSPPRGIFSNIDFDELNSWRGTFEERTTTKPVEEKEKPAAQIESMEVVYGPKVPDSLKNKVEVTNSVNSEFKPVFRRKNSVNQLSETKVQMKDSSLGSDVWVELKKVKSKKIKKNKKKHKNKHKKSKHEKKD